MFATKYRYQVLKGDVGLKVRELIRQTCEEFKIAILKGVVIKDHVHKRVGTTFIQQPFHLRHSELIKTQ